MNHWRERQRSFARSTLHTFLIERGFGYDEGRRPADKQIIQQVQKCLIDEQCFEAPVFTTPIRKECGDLMLALYGIVVARNPGIKPTTRNVFFQTKSTNKWLGVRYETLKRNDGRCELCGRSKHDGVKLTVDHIKPQSIYPALKCDLNNLQVLCSDCNMGKALDQTDWRAPKHGLKLVK